MFANGLQRAVLNFKPSNQPIQRCQSPTVPVFWPMPEDASKCGFVCQHSGTYVPQGRFARYALQVLLDSCHERAPSGAPAQWVGAHWGNEVIELGRKLGG